MFDRAHSTQLDCWQILVNQSFSTPPGLGQSAIYDPVGDRMILFGGQGNGYYNDVWSLPLSGTPVWVKLSPVGTPPSPRYLHTAVYDPGHHRMIVFGGIGGNYNGDLWTLDLTNPPIWNQVTVSGTTAPGRYHHVAVFDPAGGQMLVAGGIAGPGGPARDCWALTFDPVPTWTRLPDSPNGHYQDAAAYDSTRRRFIIQSGWNHNYNPTDETWAFDIAGPAGWTQLGVPRPGPSIGASGIYDTLRQSLVFIGGETPVGYSGDLWDVELAVNPVRWSRSPWTPAFPSPRWAATAVRDDVNNRLLLFAGGDAAGFRNDLWSLDLSGAPIWSLISPPGDVPSGRYFHSAIYDPPTHSMWIFGGYMGGFSNAVYQLTLDPLEWWSLAPPGIAPNARVGQSAIRDSRRNRMIVFGGLSGGTTPQNDVYALSLTDPPVWSRINPVGTPPTARGFHSAVYDPLCDAMLVFGGTSNYSTPLGDFWVLHLDGTPAWEARTLTPAPPPRFRAVSDFASDRSSMILWGGQGLDGQVASDAWEIISPAIVGVPERGHDTASIRLLPSWPNPMKNRATIAFELPFEDVVSLQISDITGRLVTTLFQNVNMGSGRHEQVWDGPKHER